MASTHAYDEYYFERSCGKPYKRDEGWLNFFGAIARKINAEIAPGSVLDAGCAMGFLVEKLREEGAEAFGIDISEYAIENVHESVRSFCDVGSILEPFPRKYDLIVTIEVLEHLPKPDAERAVENLCRHTDDILFSSSPHDYREVSHFNVQPPEYWAELFARQGFYRDVDFDASFITAWAVRFRRSREPVHRIVRDYERVVGPVLEENGDLRAANIELQNRLAHTENLLETEKRELAAITDGLTYRLALKLRNLAPSGSRRESLLKQVMGKSGEGRQQP